MRRARPAAQAANRWEWTADTPREAADREALGVLAAQLTELSNQLADEYSGPAHGWPGYALAERVALELGLRAALTLAPLPDVPPDRVY
jgi:hypothetical protein